MAEELGISAPPTGVFFFWEARLEISQSWGDEHPQLILDVKARLPPVSFILTMWKNSIFLVFLSQIFDPKPRKKVHFLVGFRVSLAGFSGFLQLYMVFFTRTLFFKGFVWLRWLHQSSSESERRRNVFLGGWTSPCRYHFWANPSIMLLGIWCVYIYIHIRINIPSDPNISHSSWCMDIYILSMILPWDIYIYIHIHTNIHIPIIVCYTIYPFYGLFHPPTIVFNDRWQLVAHGEHWGAAGGSINAQMSSAFVRKSLGLETASKRWKFCFFFVCGGGTK